MPEQYCLPWFWNAKKKTCSSQHTSNNPENGRQLHQKGYLIIKYPLITKYTHQRRKLYMKKYFWLVSLLSNMYYMFIQSKIAQDDFYNLGKCFGT